MHQAIPYRVRSTNLSGGTLDLALAGGTIREANNGGVDPANVTRMVLENAVIVIGRRGCCLCHVVKRLLQGLGVNPPVYEIDDHHEASVAAQLFTGAETVQFPAVFVGGKLFGGLERVMATHISGELVPILKDAGALWL